MVPFLCIVLAVASAFPTPVTLASTGASVREVANFPLGAWLENLAVRANGQLLVTRFDVPEVWSVDPPSGRTSLVARFANATSAVGITEVERDVFAVGAGNFSIGTGTTPGTYSIWRVDFRSTPPAVSKAADIAQATILNGLTTLDGSVLAADSLRGVVYRVDLRTGSSSVALSGAAYAVPPPPADQLGINGVHVHAASTLYFTNTGAGTLSRVPVHPNGTAAGAVEALVENLELPDDFALAPSGVYVAIGQGGSLIAISPSGGRTHIAGGGDSTQFATPTAAQFGRTALDRTTLYVTTGGARDAAGVAVTNAKLLAVDVAGQMS